VPWISAIGVISPGSVGSDGVGLGSGSGLSPLLGVTSAVNSKSAELSPVSPVRSSDPTTPVPWPAGPGAVSNVSAVPYPSRSTTPAAPSAGTEPLAGVTAVACEASATTPAVPLGLRLPTASGVGSGSPFAAFEAPCTR
jgi:hypothetical protein